MAIQFALYRDRVPREADLVTYWLENAREQIERGEVRRAGLLATNSIRGGVNRRVLQRIKQSGDIFFAESDRPWIQNGAAVRVSMVGFDDGTETERILDGRLMHGILHKALEQAVRWGIVPRNVCKATTPPKPNPEEIRPLDAAQARRLLETSSGNRLEALYVLAVTAGLRIGELLGLKWEDVDLSEGSPAATLRVRRTRSQAKTGPTFTAPKNGRGRSIRLTGRAAETLRSHKAAQNAERLKLGDLWEDNGLVFCTMAGRPLDFRNVANASFKPLLKKAGLPDIRFHDLRHTCATLLLSRGHHPKLVQELLGHSSVAMTLDRYSHVLPGMGDQTAAAMEAALS